MLEILQFIFSSFWVFVGFAYILSIIISGIISVCKSIITYKLIKAEYAKLGVAQTADVYAKILNNNKN